MLIQVNFKMDEGCADLRPLKQHVGDSGFDLKSRINTVLKSGKFMAIPTGLFLELPLNTEAQVRPRSGLAARMGITVLNTPGTVDASYRGEVQVILINHSEQDFVIHRGDRIAQLVIQTIPEIDFVLQDSLSDTVRGKGGFGSTGR
jgi:dUTP pyrophosphatase